MFPPPYDFMREKACENCIYFDELTTEQPCCSCVDEVNFRAIRDLPEKQCKEEMRNRLVDALRKIAKKPIMLNGLLEWADDIADGLINYGVIIPPCKVGDEVYFYKAEINEICPAKVIKITNNYCTPSMPLWITIEYESNLVGTHEVEINESVFNLVCHFTRKEAEQALKGGVE